MSMFETIRWLAVPATACGAIALTILGSQPLQAAAEELRSKMVHYEDLDLSERADAERLYDRIRLATREVCGTVDGRPASQASRVKECQDETVAKAVLVIDEAMLTEVHRTQLARAKRSRLESR